MAIHIITTILSWFGVGVVVAKVALAAKAAAAAKVALAAKAAAAATVATKTAAVTAASAKAAAATKIALVAKTTAATKAAGGVAIIHTPPILRPLPLPRPLSFVPLPFGPLYY